MSKTALLFAMVLMAALTLSGCVTVSAKGSVKAYNEELRAADEALKTAKERGAAEDCPAAYMEAAWARNSAVDTFWSCRTKEATEKLKEAKKKASELCGAVAEETSGTAEKDASPVKAEAISKGGTKSVEAQKAEAGKHEAGKSEEGGPLVLENVKFDFDKSAIKPEFRPALDGVARVLKEKPDIKLEIHGHTDSVGTEPYNQKLSERRANAVREYLMGRGIEGNRLLTVGHGLAMPVATNENDAGRAKNRRSELRPVRVR